MRQATSTLLVLAAAGIESVVGFTTSSSASSSLSSLRVGVAPTVQSSATEEVSADDIAKLEAAVAAKDSASAATSAATSTSSSSGVDTSVILPGRYATKETSIAIPFLKRPTALDGTHAGDFGFDPLGLTETYDLYTMQEAELRHGRLAMLAVVGWPLSELVAPYWMLQDGRAPSVLNGFNPLTFVATVAAFGAFGFFEYKTALRKVDDKPMGITHSKDMAQVWDFGVAGDYNFDPLGLYSSIGDSAYARKGLREVEISHGRSAMLGITAFAAWEALTGAPIVQDSMFFTPNLLLPSLAAGYVAFNYFYEVEESDMYFRFKLSSEGESRMENLKLGMAKTPQDEDNKNMQFINGILGEAGEKLGEKAGVLFEKMQESYKEGQEAFKENLSTRD